jgi:hypothetical protein
MQEIQADLIKFQAEKSQLELELMDDNASPVVFEQVRELINGFHQVLTVAPFEQRKTLMHMGSVELAFSMRKPKNIFLA